jgi:capsular polysaccharide biosynthesis protein
VSAQALDTRRFWHTLRRHKLIVGLFLVLGLVGGAAFTVLRPPLLTSKSLVEIPGAQYIQTQVVVAVSDPVLIAAAPHINPPVALATLRRDVSSTSLTPEIVQITASAKTASQAESIATAVASSLASYVSSTNAPGGKVYGQMIEPGTNATRTALSTRLLLYGGLGALGGLLIGSIIALSIDRSDRKLWERDAIADAIGVPVLASVPVAHPSSAAGWMKLLEGYDPGAVHGWSLRKALQHLDLLDLKGGRGASLTVLSLSSDSGAVALGPQLAVFASSLGIPTVLIVVPQQDTNATATLCAACTVKPVISSGSGQLRVAVGNDNEDEDAGSPHGAALTIVVAVVDDQTPQVNHVMRTTATVLGIAAGVATAEQLARVAVSAAADGRDIAGIIVADPDSADQTTGRLPHQARPMQRRPPTRRTGTVTRR